MIYYNQVGGDPAPEIKWTRQGRAQSLPDNVQMVTDRGISIHNLHPSDQGVYVCQATNKAGSITASAMLRVQVSVSGSLQYWWWYPVSNNVDQVKVFYVNFILPVPVADDIPWFPVD